MRFAFKDKTKLPLDKSAKADAKVRLYWAKKQGLTKHCCD